MSQSHDVTPSHTSLSRIWLATFGLVLFYVIIGLALRYPVNEAKILVTGDEHHYLTQTISLVTDGDLVVRDNFESGDYLDLYINELDPSQWNLTGPNGYSGHSPGVGIAVAPGWWVAGWFGVLVTLAAVMGGTFLLTAIALARTLGGHLSTPIILFLISGFVALPRESTSSRSLRPGLLR